MVGLNFFLTQLTLNSRMAAKRNIIQQPNLFFEANAQFAAKSMPKVPSYLKDHRKRLRERFVNGGADAMPDYELLELVLFRAIPRQDVKPLARKLIETFGDFNAVVSTGAAQLMDVDGIGEAVVVELKIIEAAAHRLSRARVIGKHVLSSWQALLEYCQATLAHKKSEEFHVLFLDRKNHLIQDDCLGRGTVDHVPVYPREIIKRALELDASALILVHNHPSGDPTPSTQDIEMTERIVLAATAVGISVHDHLVIGKSNEVSFRSEGLI